MKNASAAAEAFFLSRIRECKVHLVSGYDPVLLPKNCGIIFTVIKEKDQVKTELITKVSEDTVLETKTLGRD